MPRKPLGDSKRGSRAADEERITTLLYRRHPQHLEEIGWYQNLPPEEQKRAVRMGIRLAAKLPSLPPEAQQYVFQLLFSSTLPTIPVPSVASGVSPAIPDPPQKFDLFQFLDDEG